MYVRVLMFVFMILCGLVCYNIYKIYGNAGAFRPPRRTPALPAGAFPPFPRTAAHEATFFVLPPTHQAGVLRPLPRTAAQHFSSSSEGACALSWCPSSSAKDACASRKRFPSSSGYACALNWCVCRAPPRARAHEDGVPRPLSRTRAHRAGLLLLFSRTPMHQAGAFRSLPNMPMYQAGAFHPLLRMPMHQAGASSSEHACASSWRLSFHSENAGAPLL